MAHTHLTEEDRYDIYEGKAKGQTVTQIAARVGRSKSTVSRELMRNTGLRGYRPRQAHCLAQSRKQCRRGGKQVDPETLRRCFELLRQGHSPAQAAGCSAREGCPSVSHETLYRRIYADKARSGTLWRHLRCQKKRRKRYGSGRERRGQIVGRIGIESRSKRVDARACIGHWEGDTVIGKNRRYCLVTLVERKSGYALVRKVKTRHADGVAATIIDALKGCKALVRTITFDNGLEFARHAEIAAALNAKVYFADPYSSWQRGSNENFNGLLRHYFPKRSCFSKISSQRLAAVEALLNGRVRKRLAWETPAEVFSQSAKRLGVAIAS